MAANSAVMRAQNRAIAKGTDPKAATCRAKLQRARSALNRQMDRELRLREGAENLLRATTKDGGGGDSGGVGGVGRHKNKNRKLIRQTVALELSFLESNVRLLADELAELNGSVDVYQHRDDDDDDHDDDDGAGVDIKNYGGNVVSATTDGVTANNRGQRRRRRQMPMIAVPLKDTRPIDFGPPLERFIGQHYGVDLSATPGESTDGEGAPSDSENDGDSGTRRRRSLSLREAVDELTQLRLDTQTPSRDADGVRLLLRYYRQLYYVDRRFFPPSSTATLMTTPSRNYHHNRQHQQQDYHYRHNNKQQQHAVVTDAATAASSSFSSPPPAIYFEWYDSFGGPVPSCGQRTVRFEQACVLFNVAAVHTQMGAKHDRRCFGGIRDHDQETAGGARRSTGSLYTSTESETTDGATVAAQCFLRAAGAYRHIGDTFANAPARAADLRATGVLYAVMMAQAYECIFEKLQWRLLATIRHRCRLYHSGDGTEEGGRRPQLSIDTTVETSSQSGDRRGRGVLDPATRYRRTSAATTSSGGSGMNDVTTHTPSWTELAREAAHVSRMYAEVVYNSCIPDDSGPRGGKENGGIEQGSSPTVLPDVWVSVCRIKDRHYAALAYRYAACALLPYYRCSTDDRHHRRHRDRYADDETEADELLTELTTATAAVGLELTDDDKTTSATVRQQRRCKQLGTLLLEAAAAAHDRAARAQRLCRQLRTKAEGNAAGGGGLLAGALDRERQRTVRLLLLHRRNDNEYDGTAGGGDDDTHCCCRRRRCSDDGPPVSSTNTCHDCFSDDDGVDDTAVADHCSGNGDQDEFTAAGIAGIPGLDVDRGVLFRPRTKFRLMAIAPDFTDTGDDDNEINDGTTTDRRQRREQPNETADREERRADLFAGLGPVAVFSARHRFTRPRWVKVVCGGRHHHSAGDIVATVGGADDEDDAALEPIQLVDRWFGFELRSHGGGTAAAVAPATVGHVRSNSQAQHAGLRRGDIVVALKRTGDNGSVVLDIRWDTCRRVAEFIVQQCQRRRQQSSIDGCSVVIQLKVVTPITAMTASDGHSATSTTAMDPNKMYPRRRTTAVAMNLSGSPPLPPQLLPQPTTKQRRQRRPNSNGGNEGINTTNKINTWLWNPFRRRRRSVVGNKC